MSLVGPLLLLALFIVCGLPGPTDLALPLEVLGLSVVAAWLSRFIAGTVATVRISRSLRHRWVPASIHGIDCRVVADVSAQAFALGLVRPRVYITGWAIASLDPDAQRAVLLHEDHHRRTRAPLRTLVIACWSDTIGRIPGIRDVLERRLAGLEQDADRHALRHGVRRSDLARALLALDAYGPGAGFTGYSRARVEALLDPVRVDRGTTRGMPLEWVGAGVMLFGALACLT